MPYLTPSEIQDTFNDFWSGGTEKVEMSMYGLADIWEGPTGNSNGVGSYINSNTVMALETYKDSVYTIQGGLQGWLKVVSPNGTRIYNLYSSLILLINNSNAPYFSMCVLNEDEVIAGYMYINLRHQFIAPFGLDIADIYSNPFASLSNVRVHDSAWVTAIRDRNSWKLYSYSKAAPENCLPCAAKKRMAKTEFSCSEDQYSRIASHVPGYDSDGLLSYGRSSGYDNMRALPQAPMRAGECMKSLKKYTKAFNQAKLVSSDIGIAGKQVSKNCSSGMFSNIITIAEHAESSYQMSKEYLDMLLGGDEGDVAYIKLESSRITGEIAGFLSEISHSLGSNSFTRELMKDTTWWAPIWFSANSDKLRSGENAYSLLSNVQIDDFIELLRYAASSDSASSVEIPHKMGWIFTGRKGDTPVKFGKNNMTHFRFPRMECIGIQKLFEIPAFSVNGICGVETRPEGIVVWAWEYSTDSNLVCWIMTNGGVATKVAEVGCGDTFAPTSGAPMAVSKGETDWIIHDFFLADNNTIDFTEVTVPIGDDVSTLLKGSLVASYANLNEVTGTSSFYGDGLLDSNKGQFDLDDSRVTHGGWSSDGSRPSWSAGYAAYLITASEFF